MMEHRIKWVVALCVIAACSLSTHAEETKAPVEKAAAKKAETKIAPLSPRCAAEIEEEYKLLNENLKLSASQQAALRRILTTYYVRVEAYKKANDAKMDALTNRLKTAIAAKNTTEEKGARTGIRAMYHDLSVMGDKKEADFEALLTQKQKENLARHHFYQGLLSRFRRAELTDEQKTKIKAQVAKRTKGLTVAKIKGGDVYYDLWHEAHALLSDAQKSKLRRRVIQVGNRLPI